MRDLPQPQPSNETGFLVTGEDNVKVAKALMKIIEREVDKQTEALRHELQESRDKLVASELSNKALRDRLVRYTKTKSEIKPDKLNELSMYLVELCEGQPAKGWHDRAPRDYDFFPKYNYLYDYICQQDPRIVTREFRNILIRVERLEREIIAYEEKMEVWKRDVMAQDILGGTLEMEFLGIPFYQCPKGGRCELPFIDKIIERTKTKPKKIPPMPPYPKVKVE